MIIRPYIHFLSLVLYLIVAIPFLYLFGAIGALITRAGERGRAPRDGRTSCFTFPPSFTPWWSHSERTPVEWVQTIFCRGVLAAAGIRVRLSSRFPPPSSLAPTLVLGNHTSSLDGFVAFAYLPRTPTVIFKESLLITMPFLFIFGAFVGHIPIARSDRQKAVASLSAAGKAITDQHKAVLVYPEGTRSPFGKSLLPFKKGPFHLALSSVPSVQPLLLIGAADLMPGSAVVPTQGTVVLSMPPPIDVVQTKVKATTTGKQGDGDTVYDRKSDVEQLLDRCQTSMGESLALELADWEKEKERGLQAGVDVNEGVSVWWALAWITLVLSSFASLAGLV
eukprot:CAMPEP_0170751440 /NCGR_PEP_ID=MMETSP0437-20130122/11453_1 /TAXON_ID=0 /ORGANISM="Sexangularia sp." /LENGTH=335 /DNA_ID=CAMNT_0011090477 /DNA_START=43 /DNA_END=1050 /DNA_ORIENTATION=-